MADKVRKFRTYAQENKLDHARRKKNVERRREVRIDEFDFDTVPVNTRKYR